MVEEKSSNIAETLRPHTSHVILKNFRAPYNGHLQCSMLQKFVMCIYFNNLNTVRSFNILTYINILTFYLFIILFLLTCALGGGGCWGGGGINSAQMGGPEHCTHPPSSSITRKNLLYKER